MPSGGWDNTVEVKEVYDHKLCGKVVVVKCITVNGGHLDFFLEAIEHHIAVTTLSIRGEVVSVFCVWGKLPTFIGMSWPNWKNQTHRELDFAGL